MLYEVRTYRLKPRSQNEVIKRFGDAYETRQKFSRLAALRAGFVAMLKDPAFLAEMEQRKMELDPMMGEELQALVNGTFAISPGAAKRAAAARN